MGNWKEDPRLKDLDKKKLDMLEEFFDYVRENERLFRILIIQRDSSEFNHRLVNAVMDKYRMPVGEGGSLPARYAYVYCVNGVIGILKEWIHDKFPLSSRAFAGIVLQMSYRAISG